MVEVHHIKDRASWLAMRKKNVGCSEVAALFNKHPYKTALQLWAEKGGRISSDQDDNAILRRGRILEAAVIEALQEEYPTWDIRRPRNYYVMPEYRLGCTPDASCVIDGTPALIQVKVIAPEKFEAEWSETPPACYLMQLQAELFVTGRRLGVLAPMVADGYRFPVHTYQFEADDDFAEKMTRSLLAFWRFVDEGREPALMPGDAEVLGRLYPAPNEEERVALGHRDDVRLACEIYEKAAKAVKTAETEKARAAATICGALRNYSKASLPGWKINWTAIPGGTYTATRKPHRRLTITRDAK